MSALHREWLATTPIAPLVPDAPPLPAPTLPAPTLPRNLTERQDMRIHHTFTFATQRVST